MRGDAWEGGQEVGARARSLTSPNPADRQPPRGPGLGSHFPGPLSVLVAAGRRGLQLRAGPGGLWARPYPASVCSTEGGN